MDAKKSEHKTWIAVVAVVTIIIGTLCLYAIMHFNKHSAKTKDLNQGVIEYVNNDITFKLESNPTTGYDWEYEISNCTVTDDQFEANKTPGLVGAPGKHIFSFKVEDGQSTVKFCYKRSWEQKSEPTSIIECNINSQNNTIDSVTVNES